MRTVEEAIKSVRQAYLAQEQEEKAALLTIHHKKWASLFAAIQQECESDTGHILDEANRCALCGKIQN